MIKVTESAEKITPAKRTIEVKDVFVDELRFVDETGDITKEVLEKIPADVDTISFKIVVPILSDSE